MLNWPSVVTSNWVRTPTDPNRNFFGKNIQSFQVKSVGGRILDQQCNATTWSPYSALFVISKIVTQNIP